MPEVSSAALRRLPARLLAPSLPDLFFLALLLAAFTQPQGLWSLLSDGDTGWHIRTGELVLNTGRVPAADPFSFSRPGAPWFAWEWLADVVFAAAVAVARPRRRGRSRRGGAGARGHGPAGPAAAAGLRTLDRPAGGHGGSGRIAASTTWRGRMCFPSCSIPWPCGRWPKTASARAARLWLLVPLTALWVNLHGGFVAWLGTLGLLVIFCAAGANGPACGATGYWQPSAPRPAC